MRQLTDPVLQTAVERNNNNFGVAYAQEAYLQIFAQKYCKS
jgi:hypothetical protein